MNENLAIYNTVIGNNYKAAIDEANKLSKKLKMTIIVNYKSQYEFYINCTMSKSEINKIKETNVIIDV